MLNNVNLIELNKDAENHNNNQKINSNILSVEEIESRLRQTETLNTTKLEKIKTIKNMMENGSKVEEIAVALKVSSKTIYRICEKDICKGNKEEYKKLLKSRKIKES